MPFKIDDLMFAWNWNRDTALRLVDDVPDEKMADQPAAGINHPAWTLLHLSIYHGTLAAMVRGQTFPDPWNEFCGKNSSPTSTRSAYPSKNQIIEQYRRGHAEAAQAISQMSPDVYGLPIPHPTWGQNLGTIGRATLFLATNHASYHLGQISGWRRAMGLPRL